MNKKTIIVLSILGVVIVGLLVAFLVINNNKKVPEVPAPVPKEEVKEKVTIKFDSQGGEKVEDLVIDKGAQVLLPSTTRDGYLFDGWYLNNEKILSTHIYNENITVVAKWEKIKEETKTFKITYDSKGGSKVNATTLECGKTLTLPSNPTRSGYNFKGWEDKNGKVILNGAKLSCENITLYAIWEKQESKSETPVPTPTPIPQPEPEKTPEPEKAYTCPDGYELNEEKKTCTITVSAEDVCPDGMAYSSKASVCYSFASNPTSKSCKNGGTYIARERADDLCGYEEITRLTGNVSGCTQEGGTMYNNHCYKRVELATSANVSYTCPGITAYRTASDLGGTQNSGCYNLKQRTRKCPDGYTMNYTRGNCYKTIEAELK